MMQTNAQNITTASMIQYGFLALPIAFAGFPIYIHAPDYYASEFGASLSSLAAILLFLRLIDAVQDPLIGTLSDHYKNQRANIILVAALCLALGFYLLFTPSKNINLQIWFFATVLLVTTAYSILVINLTAIGGIWSSKKHQRTKIVMTREALALIGLLLAVCLPPFLNTKIAPQLSFQWMSLLLLTLLLAALSVFLNWYKKNKTSIEQTKSSSTKLNPLGQLKSLSQETRYFLSIYGMSMLASSIPAILIIFFVRDFLNLPKFIGLFLILYFLTAAFAMSFWAKLSQTLDNKKQTWMIAMALAILSFIWVLFLKPGDLYAYSAICIISGFAFGAELALPPSILADQIAEQKKQEESAFLFSQLTLLTKLTAALSTAIIFPLLEFTGFHPSKENDTNTLFVLVICYGGIPCLIKLGAIALLYFHPQSERIKER